MAEASIPVDLFSPGQVFACMGFLEAADVWLGDAEGGFDWADDANARFRLRATRGDNPFAQVLELLAQASVRACAPEEWVQSSPDAEKATAKAGELIPLDASPHPSPSRMALPIRLDLPRGRSLNVDHWADGSSRNDFKLYAGNRSAFGIACAMLDGVRTKPSKKFPKGKTEKAGLTQMWSDGTEALERAPFDLVVPLGGTFNFDPRGAWRSIDAGYSPDEQNHSVEASPVVELLAALGLGHARPDEFRTREVRYAAWGELLPPLLARPALGGAQLSFPLRRFQFALDLSGKNKVVTMAQEENAR